MSTTFSNHFRPGLLAVLVGFAFAAVLTFAPQSAHAQYTDEEIAAANLLFTSSTTTTVAGIVLTVVLIVKSDSSQDYIRENAVALRSDITLGAGSAMDDLGAIYQIDEEDRAAFGQLVRARRAVLLPLLDEDELDESRARKFFQVILDDSAALGLVDPGVLTAG